MFFSSAQPERRPDLHGWLQRHVACGRREPPGTLVLAAEHPLVEELQQRRRRREHFRELATLVRQIVVAEEEWDEERLAHASDHLLRMRFIELLDRYVREPATEFKEGGDFIVEMSDKGRCECVDERDELGGVERGWVLLELFEIVVECVQRFVERLVLLHVGLHETGITARVFKLREVPAIPRQGKCRDRTRVTAETRTKALHPCGGREVTGTTPMRSSQSPPCRA